MSKEDQNKIVAGLLIGFFVASIIATAIFYNIGVAFFVFLILPVVVAAVVICAFWTGAFFYQLYVVLLEFLNEKRGIE